MNKASIIVRRLVPEKYYRSMVTFINVSFDRYAEKSYSQEGEDIILRRIFAQKAKGFYVDIGAHHPMRFSNTYFFYKKGWRGINVDAMPGGMRLFNLVRSRDTNLEVAVSDRREKLTYYAFNDSAMNGFSEELSLERARKGRYRIIERIEMETTTLMEVLDAHLPSGVEIDFLSVDVEGLDLRVLKSNNWSKYRPKVVLAEALGSLLSDLSECEIYRFLVSKGYCLFAKTVNTLFFKLRGWPPSGDKRFIGD